MDEIINEKQEIRVVTEKEEETEVELRQERRKLGEGDRKSVV